MDITNLTPDKIIEIYQDFPRICRVCLRNSECITDPISEEIVLKLVNVSDIKVNLNDGLPQQICIKCQEDLDTSHKFLNLTKLSDSILQHVIKARELDVKKRSKKITRRAKKTDIKDDYILVVIPEKETTNSSELTRDKVTLVNTEHSYPKDITTTEEQTTNNLMEFVKNFGKDGLSDNEDIEYKCELCHEMFDTQILLAAHQAEHILLASHDFIEQEKKAEDNWKIYKLHLATFCCQFCGATFELLTKYRQHCNTLHQDEIVDYHNITHSCPICCKKFTNTRKAFIQHLSTHKSDNIHFVKVDEKGNPEPLNRTELTAFTWFEDVLAFMSQKVYDKNVYKVLDPCYCTICYYLCENTNDLQQHYYTNHEDVRVVDNETFKCPVCELAVDTRTIFYNHLSTHNHCFFIKVNKAGDTLPLEEKEIFTLPKSKHELHLEADSETLTTFLEYPFISPKISKYVQKKRKKNAKYFVCDTCGKTFWSKVTIMNHVLTHLQSSGTDYCCEKCGKTFSRKVQYAKHFKSHVTKYSNEKQRKVCNVCLKIFNNKTSLLQHMKCHVENVNCLNLFNMNSICDICGKAFENNVCLRKHIKQHSTNKKSAKKCPICSKECSNVESFDKHLAAHKNPNCVECETCKMPFTTVQSKDRHAQIHKKKNWVTYDCGTCKVSFMSQESLSAHQSQTDHSSQMLQCNVCSEYLRAGREFNNHIKTHPKYKQSQCYLCGKKLSTPQSLAFHFARHFEENAILCPHCGKKFFEKKNFDRHLLIHAGVKPYKCEYENCPRAFYTSHELKRHKDYHENRRRYTCSYCMKSFHEASQLKVHVRMHTGECPYTCPHCKKGFVTRTRCKQHIRGVHNGEGYDLIQTEVSKKVPVFDVPAAMLSKP